jgi:hypothetical protein
VARNKLASPLDKATVIVSGGSKGSSHHQTSSYDRIWAGLFKKAHACSLLKKMGCTEINSVS